MSVLRWRKWLGLFSLCTFTAVAGVLPPHIQQALEQVYPGKPLELEQDLTRQPNPDQVYRVRVGKETSVLVRHMGRLPYGQRRTFERSHLASFLHIGPRVLHALPSQGLLITEWISAVPPTSLTEEEIQVLLHHLRRLHDVPLEKTQFPKTYSIEQRAFMRLGEIKKAHPTWIPTHAAFLPQQIEKLLRVLRAPRRTCILHGDINGGNILKTQEGRLVLVDWADSVCGDPFDDLGALCFYAGLEDPFSQRHLLTLYLERSPTLAEEDRLYLKTLLSGLHIGLWLLRETIPHMPASPSQDLSNLRFPFTGLTHLKKPSERAPYGHELLRRFQKEHHSKRYQEALQRLHRGHNDQTHR